MPDARPADSGFGPPSQNGDKRGCLSIRESSERYSMPKDLRRCYIEGFIAGVMVGGRRREYGCLQLVGGIEWEWGRKGSEMIISGGDYSSKTLEVRLF